jgi:hypothetical protein
VALYVADTPGMGLGVGFGGSPVVINLALHPDPGGRGPAPAPRIYIPERMGWEAANGRAARGMAVVAALVLTLRARRGTGQKGLTSLPLCTFTVWCYCLTY